MSDARNDLDLEYSDGRPLNEVVPEDSKKRELNEIVPEDPTMGRELNENK